MVKIIDAHMHFSKIATFNKTATGVSKVNYSSAGLAKEYNDANVVLGIGMGLAEGKEGSFPDVSCITPMGLDLEEVLPSNIVYCVGINPCNLNNQNLYQLEESFQRPEVVGIKIYLGYYPVYAYDSIYDSIYKLAKKYSLPVVFHTGDTYSDKGLLKYSHPLTVDEVAVKHPEVNFVIAHFGDPWCLDAAEVIYKNPNTYADLSGLVAGDGGTIKRLKDSPLFFHHLRHGLVYCDDYTKFIFGTDWPLVPIFPYVEFIKEIIPQEYHQDVFYNTAVKVYPKIKGFL